MKWRTEPLPNPSRELLVLVNLVNPKGLMT